MKLETRRHGDFGSFLTDGFMTNREAPQTEKNQQFHIFMFELAEQSNLFFGVSLTCMYFCPSVKRLGLLMLDFAFCP